MRKFLLSTIVSVLALASGAADATPIVYNLVGVKLDDGGSLSGSFTFDADAPKACSSQASPCGTYSNVNIAVTGGTYAGATFTYAGDPYSDSTSVTFFALDGDLFGLPAVYFLFYPSVNTPPNGLSDSGGSFLIDGSAGAGRGELSTCNEGGCDIVTGPFVAITAGSVKSATTVPEPLTITLFGAGLAGLASLRRRRRDL